MDRRKARRERRAAGRRGCETVQSGEEREARGGAEGREYRNALDIGTRRRTARDEMRMMSETEIGATRGATFGDDVQMSEWRTVDGRRHDARLHDSETDLNEDQEAWSGR